MKKTFILTLTLSLVLLTACGQQGDISTSSEAPSSEGSPTPSTQVATSQIVSSSESDQQTVTSVVSNSSDVANTVTSDIKPLASVITSQAISYPSSSKTISSRSSSAPVASVDRTPFYLNLSADNIVEFGITPGRVSAESQLQSFSTKDTALIKEIVSKLNSIEFAECVYLGPMTGFGWTFWTVDENGEKTIYRFDGYYRFNGKCYQVRDNIVPLEYLMKKLNADWW